MALRSAPASAEVSRKAGRRRHRLGAFRRGPCGRVPSGRGAGRSALSSTAPRPTDQLPRARPLHLGNCVDATRRGWRPQIAPNSVEWCLTGGHPVHSVPDAPRTECLRLMALRVVVASAVVSRKVGRGRNRLGAFSLAAYPTPILARCAVCSPSSARSSSSTRSLHGTDAARPDVRRRVRPVEGRRGAARRRLRRRSAPRRHPGRARRLPVGARSAPSSAGLLLLAVASFAFAVGRTTPSRSASRASSRGSRARRRGPARSPGSPSTRLGSAEAR